MLCYYIAGCVSGVMSFVLYYPLDTIKTQQQVRRLRFSEAVALLRRQRGWSGFYRGASIPLLANGITTAAFFGAFGSVTQYLIESRVKREGIYWTVSSKLHNAPYHPHHRPDLLTKNNMHSVTFEEEVTTATFEEAAVAAGVAGFVTAVAATPIELIKTKLQIQLKDKHFKGVKDCFQQVYKYGGVRGLYRGIVPHILRNSVITGFRLFLLCNAFALCEADLFPVDSIQKIFGWGLGGICAWLFGLPFDTIKVKLQADDHIRPRYSGTRHVATHIFKKEGIRGFYHGFWNVTLKTMAVNALTFATYTYISRSWCEPYKE